ncbi:hypothetical protein BX265_0359 [Streptomyces sp. TLI_235]|nr:hypothetical protein BX265_0359 [Streptomyces sp. TLI_235]
MCFRPGWDGGRSGPNAAAPAKDRLTACGGVRLPLLGLFGQVGCQSVPPIWLGDNSSVTKKVIERLYACSSVLNAAGQSAYYGRVGGCLITGNEDGAKHCAMNVIYSLQHLGYTIPPQADAGWVGPAGPGPSYLDEGSGGPENDFTNRNTTFMTWNLLHLARDAGCRFDFENPEHR